MTREELINKVLDSNNTHIIVSGATGIGKTAIALKKVESLVDANVLVVVPQLTIIESWKQEIIKWKINNKIKFTFTTYNSLHKYIKYRWDILVIDEAHHITERVMDIIRQMWFDNLICLSATMKREVVTSLKILFPNIKTFRLTLTEAIENNILPEPIIYLIPLRLNMIDKTELIIKNPKAKSTKEIPFEKRNSYRDKKIRYIIPCTELQYNLDLDNQVEWYKRLAMNGNAVMKNIWLHKAGERLKWLSDKKTPYVKQILNNLKDKRTLTFCNSIKQSEELGSNAIHSKNNESDVILDSFNKGNINHITAVAKLDEGVNLTNCQIGIFANLNSSERIQVQRIGKL